MHSFLSQVLTASKLMGKHIWEPLSQQIGSLPKPQTFFLSFCYIKEASLEISLLSPAGLGYRWGSQLNLIGFYLFKVKIRWEETKWKVENGLLLSLAASKGQNCDSQCWETPEDNTWKWEMILVCSVNLFQFQMSEHLLLLPHLPYSCSQIEAGPV